MPMQPERMLTWNDVRDAIDGWPAEVRDLPATVWVPGDLMVSSDFPFVAGISTFDGDLPVSVGNPPSISLVEGS